MFNTNFRVSIFVIKDETWTKQKRDALSFQIQEAIKKSFIPKDVGNSLHIHIQNFDIDMLNGIEFFASVCFSSLKIKGMDDFINYDIFTQALPDGCTIFKDRSSIFKVGD